ncbi:Cell division protein [Propionibacterium freudenreichii subsp. shermanii CIRM-BIA1]|uniref:Cell division protein n=5 Tax=Propionibacterium freudenreichii TaxID=1744 RepID=D7GFZ1_PROFC|nr:Cell division protein [Propionibacterium freudenreichii subsp. shermanii CIRM-BIA1]
MPMSTETPVVVYRKRRGTELALIIVASLFGIGGFVITTINMHGGLPAGLIGVSLGWLALCVIAHLAVRIRAPYADPVILPCVIALNGLGLAMIYRLDQDPPASTLVNGQLMWTALGVLLFVGVLFAVRDYRNLQRYPYVLFLLGLVLLLMPLVPGLASKANALNGSQIWVSVAGMSFQPAEVAKIVLTLAFASYLADHRDLLQLAGLTIGRVRIPRGRDLLPIMVMWAAAVAVIVFENDYGTALLFFGLFVMMLYVATSQIRWVVIGGVLFLIAAVFAFNFVGHVQVRFDSWLHPFSDPEQNGQVISAQYGMAWGGLFGRGWGLGRPSLVPLAQSDFIASAIGEELGLTGLMALILIYGLIVARGLRAALTSSDVFGKLLAGGLSFTFALQVFAIIGGVTRLLPLTGLTTPFLSQGGTSLVANWVIVAALMQISHAGRRPAAAASNPDPDMESAPTAMIGRVEP